MMTSCLLFVTDDPLGVGIRGRFKLKIDQFAKTQ